jgi:hypothetical protein
MEFKSMKRLNHVLFSISLFFVSSVYAFAPPPNFETNDKPEFKLPDKEWRLISLPVNPPGAENTVKKVFGDDISGDYGMDWALFEYNARENQYKELTETDSVVQGKGYWIIQVTGKEVSLDLPSGTSKSIPSIPLVTPINQSTQWNLLGFPFAMEKPLNVINVKGNDICTDSCDLDDSKQKQLVHNNVWVYDGNAYVKKGPKDNLKAWDGFWIPVLSGSSGHDLSLVGKKDTQDQNVTILHGGKPDNSGDGSYYPWDDADAVRGLVFDAHQPFVLKSVKVYNQAGQAATRTFTLYDRSNNEIAHKTVAVSEGEHRIQLDMKIPAGSGYKLMADVHKGLYRNNNASYPFQIGSAVTITGSDINQSHYYFFYDWEIAVKRHKPDPNPDRKPYVPSLDFGKRDVYGSGTVVLVSTTSELSNAIQRAVPNTTILLEDGTYENVHIRFPKGKHHITLKAEHRHQAKLIPGGWDDGSAIIFSRANTKDEEIHHINFIGLNVDGRNELKQFIKSEGGATYSVHHVYFYGMDIHHLGMAFYSGLHSHDWTVDDSELHNSVMSHMWYMMGWHHSVQNSSIYNAVYDALVVRGYYPDGEKHTYIHDGDSSCHGNIYVKDRGARTPDNGFLAADDWTHTIINNQFTSWSLEGILSRGDKNPYEGYHIGIAYETYGGDAPCGAERVYLPPQNITIAGNSLSNSGNQSGLSVDGIMIAARKGINNSDLASVNGINIHNNIFVTANESDHFISAYNSHVDLNQLRNDEVHDNTIQE